MDGYGQMDPNALMEMLSDPAVADQLAQMGVYGDRQALLGQAARRADEQRYYPSARGQYAGGMYVAASPLEHLTSGVQRYRGEQGLRDVMAQQQSAMKGDVTARQALAQAMSAAMRKARTSTPPSVVNPQAPASGGRAGPFLPGQGYEGMPDGAAPGGYGYPGEF